jgi:hypothetical protein
MPFELRRYPVPGLPVPSPLPVLDRLGPIKALTPGGFVASAMAFLRELDQGVVGGTTGLGITKAPQLISYQHPPATGVGGGGEPYPAIFFVANPVSVHRDTRVRCEVWNQWILGWGRLQRSAPHPYSETDSVAVNFYDNVPGARQYWLLEPEDADSLFNLNTGLYDDDGIFINLHQEGCASALRHEIFHAFEGTGPLCSSGHLCEGFAEYFGIEFARAFHPRLGTDVFEPYRQYFDDAAKLARMLSATTCARALYLGDETAALSLLPMCDPALQPTIPVEQRLSADGIRKLTSLFFVRDNLSRRDKEQQAWYRQWVAAHPLPAA